MKKNSALHFVLAEFVFWYSAPILFAGFYIWNYANPISSGGMHLYAISLIVSATLLLRALIDQIIHDRKIAALISSGLYASVLSSIFIYYALVIIGLESWGRVITEELIVSYASQAPAFSTALGLSYKLIIATLIGTYLIIWIICYFFISKFNWKFTADKISRLLLISLLLSVLVFCLYRLYVALDSPIASKEPFYLSLTAGKPGAAKHSLSQGLPPNETLNTLEKKILSSYKPSSNAERRNLILIVVDALRPDHMGVYGYARNTTPYLSKLEKLGSLQKIHGVRASCSESSCGLASLANSRYVHQFPEKPFTLQQVLKHHGYKVHMILGGDHTNFYGLREAYGQVDSYFDASMATKGRYVNDDEIVVEKINSLPSWDKTPTMIQFHLMSAHVLGIRLKEYTIFKPAEIYSALTTDGPDEKYTNFYDNGVLQADAMINKLLEILKDKHYLDDALVIITADHGESLGEHNLFAHSNNVMEESLNIPLLIISYGKNPKPVIQKSQFASQVDIAPTALHELEMPIPENWSGNPIQIAKNPDFTFFLMVPKAGLYDHRDSKNVWKYWQNIRNGDEFAYNLSVDPKESNNLIWKVPNKLKQDWRSQLSGIKLQ